MIRLIARDHYGQQVLCPAQEGVACALAVTLSGPTPESRAAAVTLATLQAPTAQQVLSFGAVSAAMNETEQQVLAAPAPSSPLRRGVAPHLLYLYPLYLLSRPYPRPLPYLSAPPYLKRRYESRH